MMTRQGRAIEAVWAATAFVLLASCGGGGGDGGGSTASAGGTSGNGAASPSGSSTPAATATPAAATAVLDGTAIGTARNGRMDRHRRAARDKRLAISPARARATPTATRICDLCADGKQVALPANIGVAPTMTAQTGCVYPVHTDDASGKIRMDVTSGASYTLGQVLRRMGTNADDDERRRPDRQHHGMGEQRRHAHAIQRQSPASCCRRKAK